MKVYLAHQITGLHYDDVMAYYDRVSAFIATNTSFEAMCPMVAKERLKGEGIMRSGGYSHPVSTNHAIYERDQWMVRQSDIILIDLIDNNSAIGCLMELAWASLLGKHTIVVMEPSSIYRHAFVLEAADIVFDKLDDALDYLKSIGSSATEQTDVDD